jgi:hypothetical protein
MPFQHRALPLALLALFATTPCLGQDSQADSTVRQFAWGPVNVLVIADTVSGLGIWAATSSTEFTGERREFAARFNPDSLDRWLNQAHAVITHGSDADSGSTTTLRTAPLVAVDSLAIVVLREREASRWSDRTELVFLGKDRRPVWSVAATSSEVNDFVTSVFVQATRSRLVTANRSPHMATAAASSHGDRAPRLIRAGLMRPPKSLAGISARVTFRFVIGTDGKPERGSIRTVTYSDSRFVDAAIATIMDSRFSPGELNGVPVRVTVVQGVTFDGRAQPQNMDNFPKPRPLVGDVLSSPPF